MAEAKLVVSLDQRLVVKHPDQRHADGFSPKRPKLRELKAPRNVHDVRHARIRIGRHRHEHHDPKFFRKCGKKLRPKKIGRIHIIGDEQKNRFHGRKKSNREYTNHPHIYEYNEFVYSYTETEFVYS